MPQDSKKVHVERTQLGVRMEKRLVKVLKALAEYYDLSLGDLLLMGTRIKVQGKTIAKIRP